MLIRVVGWYGSVLHLTNNCLQSNKMTAKADIGCYYRLVLKAAR